MVSHGVPAAAQIKMMNSHKMTRSMLTCARL
jgi:hypothetical protein